MMEASAALSFQSCPWIGFERTGRKTGSFLRFPSGFSEERRVQTLRLADSRWCRVAVRSGHHELKISCCYKKSGGSENFHNSVDEALILKRKSEDVLPYLNARCIYLVGMMGSGKTTVGKILSEVLGYSFFDSDKLVEQAVGISSVAQIFKDHSEAFFRDNEHVLQLGDDRLICYLHNGIADANEWSKVLRDLSSMHRLVVATGGGAVIRPINWRYMKEGISVWLDVPLDALARRIAAVGTDSRPLLHQESGDPYTKAFVKLTRLYEQRGKAYANADARVCLEHIAAKQGQGDVCALTPTAIAIEALVKIECFLTENAAVSNSSYLQG